MSARERDFERRRLRPAVPFQVLPAPGAIRLVAGEDLRYTLVASGIEHWGSALLARLDGREVEAALAPLSDELRPAGRELIVRLLGERALIDAPPADAHAARAYRVEPHGEGALRAALDRVVTEDSAPGEPLWVYCQDRPDDEAALAFARRMRDAGRVWMWASTAALQRGYVSPVWLPDAGPCFGCLVAGFERISPAPEIRRALRDHVRAGGVLDAVLFAPAGIAVMVAIVAWKARALAAPEAPAALYRLHVIEASSCEVATHRVLPDPECAICGRSRA